MKSTSVVVLFVFASFQHRRTEGRQAASLKTSPTCQSDQLCTVYPPLYSKDRPFTAKELPVCPIQLQEKRHEVPTQTSLSSDAKTGSNDFNPCLGSCRRLNWVNQCITGYCEGNVTIPERNDDSVCFLVGVSSMNSISCEIKSGAAYSGPMVWRKWYIISGLGSQCAAACYDASSLSPYTLCPWPFTGNDPEPLPTPSYSNWKFCWLSQITAPSDGAGCSVEYINERKIWKTSATGQYTKCTVSCMDKKWNYAEGIITISTPGRLNSISNPFFDCYLAGVSRDAGEEQQQQCEVNTAGDNVYVWKLDAQGITCDASCACKLDDDQCLPF